MIFLKVVNFSQVTAMGELEGSWRVGRSALAPTQREAQKLTKNVVLECSVLHMFIFLSWAHLIHPLVRVVIFSTVF